MLTPKLRYLAPILFAILALIAWNAYRQPSALANNSTSLQLQPPPFVQDAVAAEQAPAAFDIGQKLDAEAGISAYYKSPDEINLSQVKSLFRTIELETADYIIGSIPVPSNPEELFDVHVYVHKTGWILGYYLRDDPVSKIVDARGRTIETSKLKSVVASVAGNAGAPFSDVTYYDFRYPNATNLMFIAEDASNGNSFTLNMPSTYGYFERSWAHGGHWYVYINGARIDGGLYYGNYGGFGSLTASQLLPGETHTVAVQDYGVIALLYRIP